MKTEEINIGKNNLEKMLIYYRQQSSTKTKTKYNYYLVKVFFYVKN